MSNKIRRLYEFDKFLLDASEGHLTRDGEPIQLPPKAFEMLVLLVENGGRVLEKDFLLEALWTETFVEEANISQNIYLLRKTLGKTPDGKSFIETLPKRGYKFTPEIKTIEADENALVVSKVTNIRARITTEEIEDKAASEAPAPAAAGISVARKTRLLPRAALTVLAAFVVVSAVGAGVYFGFFASAKSPAQIKSIAVMPFKTIGGQEADEGFLGLGMADAIITRLGKTGKINASPTDAVRRYAEKGADGISAARSLGAESFLTGNIQRDGERFRVTVQLVRTGDNQTLWSDRFDEKSTDVFSLQDKISQRLAAALTLRLTGDEQKNLTRSYTDNVEAYNLYLQGRFHLAKRTPEFVQKAIGCFEQAARLDSNFALAYAGLADAYALTASGLPPLERFPKAKSAALRALELDETLAEAHTSLAFILYKSEWNWLEAETHFRRAVEINPNYAQAHHWFGEMLGLLGRFDEGLIELREAERLDPLSQPVKSDLGRILYRARRYDEAVAYAQKTLELDPNYRNAYTTILYASEMRKNYPEAVEANLNYLRLSGFSAEELEQSKTAFTSGGWRNYWRRQLEIRQKSTRGEFLQAYSLTEIYLRLGDHEQALTMLEKSFDERGDAPYFVRAEPLLDALRGDSRFQHLLRRSGF